MKRGEVWWVELEPVRDNEILKTRPCLIVSPNAMIEGLRTVIVAPMVRNGQGASFRPPVAVKDMKGPLLLDQIRAVDKSKLCTRMGKVDDKSLGDALATLRSMFSE